LPGLSWHFWFLSTWCLYHWERDCVAAQELKRKWRLYQATEVVPSSVTRGICIPNMLPGRPISGGSVLNGQA
jgi:hypothetical protein